MACISAKIDLVKTDTRTFQRGTIGNIAVPKKKKQYMLSTRLDQDMQNGRGNGLKK